jgi:hypothetical protein
MSNESGLHQNVVIGIRNQWGSRADSLESLESLEGLESRRERRSKPGSAGIPACLSADGANESLTQHITEQNSQISEIGFKSKL